jgi:putative N6-adenine-specific DNA methylase
MNTHQRKPHGQSNRQSSDQSNHGIQPRARTQSAGAPPRRATASRPVTRPVSSPIDIEDNIFAAFASCTRGLEQALADELAELGAYLCKPVFGGVEFEATWHTLIRTNLWTRFAGRIGLRIAKGPCTDEHALYRLAYQQPWEQWFGLNQTFRTDLNNLGTDVQSLRFAQLKLKDAVCDAFRQVYGERPSVSVDAPDVRIFGGLSSTEASLYIDLSGENLFKRGWRLDQGAAPLKENLAAGLLHLSRWELSTPLLDPFCGSGTIPIEAACIAADKAPGLDRTFGFEALKPHKVDIWEPIWTDASKRFEQGLKKLIDAPEKVNIQGSDITRKLIDIAKENAEAAGLEPLLEAGILKFQQKDVRVIEPTGCNGLLLTNPPYGERVGAKGLEAEEDQAYIELFKDFGTVLKQHFAGWRVNILSGDLELRHAIGLSPKRKSLLYNGGIECRLFDFPIADGSYRPRAAKPSSD